MSFTISQDSYSPMIVDREKIHKEMWYWFLDSEALESFEREFQTKYFQSEEVKAERKNYFLFNKYAQDFFRYKLFFEKIMDGEIREEQLQQDIRSFYQIYQQTIPASQNQLEFIFTSMTHEQTIYYFEKFCLYSGMLKFPDMTPMANEIRRLFTGESPQVREAFEKNGYVSLSTSNAALFYYGRFFPFMYYTKAHPFYNEDGSNKLKKGYGLKDNVEAKTLPRYRGLEVEPAMILPAILIGLVTAILLIYFWG